MQTDWIYPVCYPRVTPRRAGNPRVFERATPKMNLGKNFCGQNAYRGLVNHSNRDAQFLNQAKPLERDKCTAPIWLHTNSLSPLSDLVSASINARARALGVRLSG